MSIVFFLLILVHSYDSGLASSFIPLLASNGSQLCAAGNVIRTIRTDDIIGVPYVAPGATKCSFFCTGLNMMINCIGFNYLTSGLCQIFSDQGLCITTYSKQGCMYYQELRVSTACRSPIACMVEAVSWGFNINGTNNYDSGHIAINGVKVITTSTRLYKGFHTVELNVSSCSSSNILQFDTYGNRTNSENMATYINSLPLNTVLIGITSWEASRYLTQNAKSALMTIGVDVKELKFRGKAAFVALSGQQEKTASQVASPDSANLKIAASMTACPENSNCIFTQQL